ncbi:MAG: hypothetical protein IV086_09370 [Hyphomonadaceae bacterium]|nr:MAG: hypothetical protein FD160_263 [Caulobacteraceae bacterium]MBT9445893.1 hypothetical protein [Hyphomonadaceae bacterium]TPW08557.1 MAG: hypothetical protein FD124_299 [Alphaproteobacteria bacterium]
MRYHEINADHVLATIGRLERRICERFPGRGLAQVCAEFTNVARKDRDKVLALRKPYRWVQAGVASLLALGATALFFLLKEVKLPSLVRLFTPGDKEGAMLDLFQGIDSAVNVIALFGVGLFFLLRHEERDKRRLALEDLYELRSLAHVIDMHQLTKDPTTLLAGATRTASSPKDTMSTYELVRYLDYCSEMLSLVAKVGALYAQDVRDPVVIELVSDLESTTADLSREIWQKIMIVEQMDPARAG